jgi:PAS domain-containing protein
MLQDQSHGFRRVVIQCLVASVALAFVTFVCFRLQLNLATAAAAYLIVIVVLSLQGSFLLSAVFSLFAVGLLAFAAPIFDLWVTDPLNAVEIVAFWTTSAVITFLVSRVRKSAARQENLTQELRRREAYLAEAQRLSHTGSVGWRVSTGEILWSEETFRIFQYDQTTTPTVDLVLHRVHPEDVAFVKQTIERASQDGKDFEHEYRLLMPDGSVKHVHVVAHALCDESGSIEFDWSRDGRYRAAHRHRGPEAGRRSTTTKRGAMAGCL